MIARMPSAPIGIQSMAPVSRISQSSSDWYSACPLCAWPSS